MFAGAAREAVFSNAKVVRRINAQFIPVALKAGLVNNPPAGLEGELYAEIGRSKPAPQGICVVNSAGKVLDWVLMFDDNESILKFLDHVLDRYAKFPDAKKPFPAERFMRFPSRKLADSQDTTGALKITDRHIGERCPAKPAVRKGTLVGRIIGRALDKQGKPVADTLRQEHYMEARFEVPPNVQESLAAALVRAGAERFRIPDDFVRALVSPAFLGQLDVDPLGGVPGSKNDSRKWEFWGRRVGSGDRQPLQVRIEGQSEVAGGQSRAGARTDGRMWEHEVNLTWEGYVDVDTKERRLKRLVAVAVGNEKLRWGNKRWTLTGEPDVAHLPAGHPIDLKCGVRYGLVAEPCAEDEILKGAADDGRNRPQPPRAAGGQRPNFDRQIMGELGPQFVALRARVWKELKLSGDQRQVLAKARETEIEAFSKLMGELQREREQTIGDHRRKATKRLNETLARILDKKQQSRLRQIGLQQQGLFALADPVIQERLKLTDEQRQGFVNIVQHLQRRFQSLQQQGQGNPRQLQQQMMKVRREQLERIEGLLTEDQKRRWSELVGKPFNLDSQPTNQQ